MAESGSGCDDWESLDAADGAGGYAIKVASQHHHQHQRGPRNIGSGGVTTAAVAASATNKPNTTLPNHHPYVPTALTTSTGTNRTTQLPPPRQPWRESDFPPLGETGHAVGADYNNYNNSSEEEGELGGGEGRADGTRTGFGTVEWNACCKVQPSRVMVVADQSGGTVYNPQVQILKRNAPHSTRPTHPNPSHLPPTAAAPATCSSSYTAGPTGTHTGSRRSRPQSSSTTTSTATLSSSDHELRLRQREEEYRKARERIFGEANPPSRATNTPTTTTTSSPKVPGANVNATPFAYSKS